MKEFLQQTMPIISEEQFYGKEEIECDLFLPPIKKIPKGFHPVIKGDLYINVITKIPKGFRKNVTCREFYFYSIGQV